MKLSNIIRNERPLAVEVETVDGAGVINICYKPSAITPASESERRSEADGKMVIELIMAQLVVVMAKWDLEDDGVIIPITEEGLSNVPNLVLGTIWEAIIADIGEKKRKKEPSSPGSFGPA